MSNDVSDPRFRTTVPRREWEQVNRLRSAVDHDERETAGRIHLTCDGTRRVWTASNRYRALRYYGGEDSGLYSVSVPPLLASFASISTLPDGESTLEVSGEDGEYRIVLGGAGGGTSYDLLSGPVLNLDELFERREGIAEAKVDIQDFRFLWSLIGLHRDQRTQPYHLIDDDGPQVPVTLFISPDVAGAEARHAELGSTLSTIPAQTKGVTARRAMTHDNLRSALEGLDMLIAFGSDAEGIEAPFFATIVMHDDEDGPVQFFGLNAAAVVMPRLSRASALRDHVESVITESLGSVASERDEDGDYPLFRHRVPVYGRLVTTDEAAWLQVFTVLLSNVECTPELLKELNDLNQHLSYAPLFHEATETGPGQVVSEIDLLADTLDPEELRAAVKRIHEVALSITPTLAAFFGGEAVADPAELRWATYRDTVVEAELVPETLVALTGDAGVEPWPFPGPVYVITGCNPQGVSLGEERHDYINQQIAEDVVGRGGRYLMGVGRSPDGSHVEPSIIAWRISRADAIDMGNKANQDAIFEIDADEMRLLSCHDDRVESRPRRSA